MMTQNYRKFQESEKYNLGKREIAPIGKKKKIKLKKKKSEIPTPSPMERKVMTLLKKIGVSFIREKKFEGCTHPNTGNYFRFDFYLPAVNLVIEYDGQHHKTDDYFKWADKVKDDYLESVNIPILRLNKRNFRNAEKLVSKFLEK